MNGPKIRAEHVTFQRLVGTDETNWSIVAQVQGQRRTFFVDRDLDYGDSWYCSCVHGPTCAHIRAVKEAIAAGAPQVGQRP